MGVVTGSASSNESPRLENLLPVAAAVLSRCWAGGVGPGKEEGGGGVSGGREKARGTGRCGADDWPNSCLQSQFKLPVTFWGRDDDEGPDKSVTKLDTEGTPCQDALSRASPNCGDSGLEALGSESADAYLSGPALQTWPGRKTRMVSATSPAYLLRA